MNTWALGDEFLGSGGLILGLWGLIHGLWGTHTVRGLWGMNAWALGDDGLCGMTGSGG